MSQRLFLVYGGELVEPSGSEFRDPSKLHVVGIFTDADNARAAWKAEAQRTVDNAHMRYYLVPLPQGGEDDGRGNAAG